MSTASKFATGALLAFGVGYAAQASAQQLQPDGSLMYGGVRLYKSSPPPAAQNPSCRSALQQGLGVIGMGFYGVEPWITNHPQLERNCVTLLDIPPLTNSPHLAEMSRTSKGLWSRVTRVRMPPNEFGWREGYGFAWCADRSCDRNVLTIFADTQIIGFCSADRKEGGVRYALAEQFRDAAVTAVAGYRSCVADPRGATADMARIGEMAGARRVEAPVVSRSAGGGGRSRDDGEIQAGLNRDARENQRMAAEAAREQARAAAQWERLSRPNELGW